MKIKIIKDSLFSVDIIKTIEIANKNCKTINFEIIDANFNFQERLVCYPETQIKFINRLKKKSKSELLILFTEVPYDNNYFYEELNEFYIVSFYGWKSITSLPTENGVFYWLCEIILRQINVELGQHYKNTGCLSDFLAKKSGIDLAMRHSGLCDTCQRKIKKGGLNKKDSKIFDDLISLLDVLSKNSRWSKSVLNSDQIINIPKVKTVLSSKQKDIINVLIASPSDAYLEREILLKKLERKWTHRYEELTGYRIICHGWEEIASQSGYPQDVLNDLILPKIDIVLGVLRHKLGTPTVNPEGEVRAESGTAEEIYYAIEKNSEKVLCMLYCFATPPNPFFNAHDFEIIRRDYLEVEGFKIRIEKKVVLKLYDDENNLLSLVVEDLLDNITEKFRK